MYTHDIFRDDFKDITITAIKASRLESAVGCAILELSDLGLIHKDGQKDETGKITVLAHTSTAEGKFVAQFPIEPVMLHLMEAAVRLECLEEMMVIVPAARLQ
ncbi:hypothetical protein LQW54_001390 [Pestalotiopsis sp. IQ-011]